MKILERKRRSDQRNKRSRSALRKTCKKIIKDAKIGRIRREEREREQEKTQVKRRISGEEQRKKKIQRAPENGLKRGLQQKEANYKGSEKEEKLNGVLSRFSLTPEKFSNAEKFKPFFANHR